MSMLKITDISISKICKTAIDFMAGGAEKIVVQSFAVSYTHLTLPTSDLV